jgi:hypothetical protein
MIDDSLAKRQLLAYLILHEQVMIKQSQGKPAAVKKRKSISISCFYSIS